MSVASRKNAKCILEAITTFKSPAPYFPSLCGQSMDLKFEVKSFVVFASDPLFQILGFPFFNSSAVRSFAHFALLPLLRQYASPAL